MSAAKSELWDLLYKNVSSPTCSRCKKTSMARKSLSEYGIIELKAKYKDSNKKEQYNIVKTLVCADCFKDHYIAERASKAADLEAAKALEPTKQKRGRPPSNKSAAELAAERAAKIAAKESRSAIPKWKWVDEPIVEEHEKKKKARSEISFRNIVDTNLISGIRLTRRVAAIGNSLDPKAIAASSVLASMIMCTQVAVAASETPQVASSPSLHFPTDYAQDDQGLEAMFAAVDATLTAATSQAATSQNTVSPAAKKFALGAVRGSPSTDEDDAFYDYGSVDNSL